MFGVLGVVTFTVDSLEEAQVSDLLYDELFRSHIKGTAKTGDVFSGNSLEGMRCRAPPGHLLAIWALARQVGPNVRGN